MKKLYIALILSIMGTSLWSQDEMFKSLFIYNFTKNIEWPAEYNSGDFVITVLGNSAIIAELEKIAKLKKVGNQTIVIKKVNEVTEIDKCHMIYIVPSKSTQLSNVLTKLTGKPVVIIGDQEGLAKNGAGLNFVKIDGKQKFEINQASIEKGGLKVNSYLVTLGIVVK